MLYDASFEVQLTVNSALISAAAYLGYTFLHSVWSLRDMVPRDVAVDLSPAAKFGLLEALLSSHNFNAFAKLTRTGPDFGLLYKNYRYFLGWDGRRYLNSEELRLTMADDNLESALAASFNGCEQPLIFRLVLPRTDFIQRLIEVFH